MGLSVTFLKNLLIVLGVGLAISSAFGGCGGGAKRPPRHLKTVAESRKDASYYYLLAEMEGRRNRAGKAIEYLDQAIDQDDRQPRFWYKRAFFNAANGQMAKAESDIRKAIELDLRDAESWTLLGKIHHSQDHKVEAAVAYQKALSIDPVLEDANILLIETYVAQNDPKSALRVVTAWERREPESVQPFFYEAWLYQNFFKNIPRTAAAYQKILNLDPENAKALQALAEIYVGQKNDQKVLDVFRQMEVAQPGDVSLKLKMALIYYEQKRYEEAIAKFQELQKSRPEDERITYYLGVVYENLKRDADAEAQFRKIKANSNFFKDARLHLAYLKVRGDKRKEAIDLLEEAIDIRPETGPFYEYLAEIYRDQGEMPAAIETLKTGIRRSGPAEKEALYYNLGLAYDRMGQFEECIRSLRQVLKINPQNASALNYIGYSYADRGIRLDEALQMLQKASSLKPDDGFITDSLGWVYFKRGETDQALVHIQKAYTQVPKEATIIEHLADIYLKKGEAAKALKHYREALGVVEKKKVSKETAEEKKKERDRLLKKIQEIAP